MVMADVNAGRVGGSLCPNCPTRPGLDAVDRLGRLGAFTVRRCRTCGLLYRPTGLTRAALARFYYSRIYDNANLATDLGAVKDLDKLRGAMGSRRRGDLIGEVAPLARGSAVVYVLGCS